MTLEILVDDGLCVAARSCMARAPELFALGEEGVATVLADADADADVDEGRAVNAAKSCPNGAIAVRRDGIELV